MDQNKNNNIAVSVATVAILAFSPITANADSLSTAVLACKSESNALKRLICFDKIADTLQRGDDVTAATITPPPGSNMPTSTPRTSSNDFGLENSTPDALNDVIANIRTDNRKRRVFTLENGQVWRETEINRTRIKVGNSITIEKGLFGGFQLSVNGSNRKVQVKRIS